ncbi:hypothetical protein [Caenimonas sp. SL110]|uniref:hypothetical protein n=1 Tax=Caenimonas sp. SL110 TaxID=1450524 RepID=UPI00069FD702|nr:hypothetical protein [Caenimonas sp. SL110]
MSFLNRIPGAFRRETAPKYQSLDQPRAGSASQRPKADKRISPDAVQEELQGFLEVDDQVDQLRQAVTGGVKKMLAALYQGDREAMMDAQHDLYLATQGLFDLGLSVGEEYVALVEEVLGDLPGEEVAAIDERLAELDWEGSEMREHFQLLDRALKAQLYARAMPNQDGRSREVAQWKRDHRDISVQLNWLARPIVGSATLHRAAATLTSLMPEEVSLLRPDDPQRAQREHGFQRHVKLLLADWSPEWLVCLDYNLKSLAPSADPDVQLRVSVIARHLCDVMERRRIEEPSPERLMLRLADGAIDPHVLAGWMHDRRVDPPEVDAAMRGWPTHILWQIVARRDRNPFVFTHLSDMAEVIVRERASQGVVPESGQGDTTRFFRFFDEDDSVAPLAQAAETARKAIDRYTTWGSRFSVGSVLNQALRYLTLSEPARKFGNWVQRGHDSGVQYAAGAVIKGLASITGAASAVVASVVTVAETIVANVVGTTLRIVGSAALGLAGVSAKLVGLASPSASRAGDRIVGTAKGLVKGISLVNNTARQETIPPHMMTRARDMARLARITGSTTADVRAQKLPEGFTRANRGVVPREILSIEGGGNGKASKLRFDEASGTLSGDRWSGLKVGVYVEEDAQGNGIAYHLSFVGTQAGRPATFKSDAAQSFLGFEDSAFHEADAIVKAFVARYGADRIRLQGHSLGGGIAQWAGIRNSGGDHPVKVTCFNAAGLHINMRNRLGHALIAKSDIEHFNTAKDFLSQKAEGARSPFLGAQVGRRYVIPESRGHSLRHHVEGLDRLAA